MSPSSNRCRTTYGGADENTTTRDSLAAEVEWLSQHVESLEYRLQRVENSLFFRFLRAAGGIAIWLKHKVLLTGPAAIRAAETKRCYRKWLARESASAPSRQWHIEQAAAWTYQPSVDIFLRMSGVPPERVRSAVASLFRQTYTRWRLVPGNRRELASALDAECLRDPRVANVDSATGDYVAFVDANDLLDPYALQYMIESVQSEPAELIYADEDLVDSSGHPVAPDLKPDWSPVLLEQCMYLGNFLIARRESLARVSGEAEWNLPELYDMARLLGEHGKFVKHVPRILNHRRGVQQPVSEKTSSKPAFREFEPVSVVICSRQPKLLRRCLEQLRKTAYPAMEIVVVEHETGDAATDATLRVVTEEFGCRSVTYRGPFNFSEMSNLGVSVACGNYLVFFNDDVWALTADWLEKLTAPLSDRQTAIIGAKLLYPNGTIQHAGITIGINGAAGHPGRGLFHSPYWKWLDYTREVSAVTGACLAIRRDVFRELNGFDPTFPVNYNDVDLCLRARRAGYRVLIETSAPLQHAECQTREPVVRLEEHRLFFKRWSSVLHDRDPYYNPNLTLKSENAALG
jgi:GT2 family glycosyltransferase